MSYEFELPDVGEGVAEGELVEWHVDVDDDVAEDDVLAEVETDKAVVDLPSPVAGTVQELHAEVGDVVPVGDVLVTIDVDGEPPEEATVEPEESTPESEEGDTTETPTSSGRVFAPPSVRRLARELGVDVAAVSGSGPGGRVTEHDVREAGGKGGSDDEAVASAVSKVDEAESEDESTGPTSAVSKVDDEAPKRKSAVRKVTKRSEDGTKSEQPGTAESTEAADREQTLATPAARRVARKQDVDIDDVPTEKTRDGEAFVEPADVRAYAETQPVAQEAEAETAATAERAGEAAAAGEAVETERERREPYRGIRRTIGEQMEESVYTAPHASHHDTAVVDDLVETRAALQDRASERGIQLTHLPFVMKAVVAALKEYPVLNTTLDEDNEEIVYKQYYNLGVAVATDDGLMVPVVENVDQKSVLQLASEAGELAERARDRDLAREEMQGGTFSITNFGAIGGEYATPIINYPETAILGLGSIEQRPTVRESEATQSSRNASGGAASTGEVVAAHTLPLSLSIDHRVIDGAEAARFVNTVVEYLENPELLLLE